MKIISAAVLAVALVACATPYQPNGLAGGFTDTRLGENTFRVSFQGNGFTRAEDAQQMLLLRCAEVAEAAGFRYFVQASSESSIQKVTQYTPAQVQTTGRVMGNTYASTSTVTGGQPMTFNFPSSNATIVAFKERPPGATVVFETKYIVESLGPKFRKN